MTASPPSLGTWHAIPGLGRMPRDPVILLAAVLGMVAVLVVPLPAPVLDGALACNLGFAALILTVALTGDGPMALSSFPTLLLGTTLLRLGLNVATTRRILGQGDAGTVVEAFAHLVAGGDVVLGLVVLLLLTLVMLLVVGKGAERVAEVAARFALDALPGQQMAIDADVRSGTLTAEQARSRRDELAARSRFHGALDGAMKFVKGDAICGVVLTGLNLVVGLGIGVLRDGLPWMEAVDRYARLTVGDGLVSQLPALLVALSAGLLATRAPEPLAPALGRELLERPIGPGAVAVALGAMALAPGMPTWTFLWVAAGFAGLGVAAGRSRTSTPTEVSFVSVESETDPERAAVGGTVPAPDDVPALGIDLDPELSERLGLGSGQDQASELVARRLPEARDHVFDELGLRVPAIQVRSHTPGLGPGEVEFRLRGVPLLRVHVPVDRWLALTSPARLRRYGIEAEEAEHPLGAGEAAWIPPEAAAGLRRAQLHAWDPAGVLALHVVRVVRRHASALVGVQEVADRVRALEAAAPDLVRETVPRVVSLSTLTDVVRRLLDEGISVRDFRTVLEALAERGDREADPVVLTEAVRWSLAHRIAHDHSDPSGRLSVVLLDPDLEEMIRHAIVREPGGSHLALEPELRDGIVASMRRTLDPVVRAGVPPVVLTDTDIRRYLHKLLEHSVPGVTVLSLQELPGHLPIEPLGRVEACFA